MTTIGGAIVRYLEARGVPVVFGLPGVHTVELYRGLAAARIRHVTARHEQGAGFMADGFARVSGRAGVAFVITGPGVTNILTPMAQARSESVPMLVVSSVNETTSLGLGLGHLHELPNQRDVCALVACQSWRVGTAGDLMPALEDAYRAFQAGRPGPMHIEVPLDVLGAPFEEALSEPAPVARPVAEPALVERAWRRLAQAEKPLILAGGGVRWSEAVLRAVAEHLQAPVVQTINARGLMHRHPLAVPASPSLEAVRGLLRDADAVLAVGTELGTTDYDIYRDGGQPPFDNLIRVDICREQLARHPAEIALCGEAGAVLAQLEAGLAATSSAAGSSAAGSSATDWGAARAAETRARARAELPGDYAHLVDLLETIRDTLPDSILVGDSTQPVYAGNLYYDHDRAGGWFNSSAGYGALGYAIPAAIGAAFAAPGHGVVSIAGDGGAQFTLPELMTAVDEKLPITFLIWNNGGYREIETSMAEAGVSAVGCDPTPPDFAGIAKACGIPFQSCAATTEALAGALRSLRPSAGPVMIEVDIRG